MLNEQGYSHEVVTDEDGRMWLKPTVTVVTNIHVEEHDPAETIRRMSVALKEDLGAVSLSIAAAVDVAEVKLKAAQDVGGVLLEGDCMERGSERVGETHVDCCKMQGCFSELQNVNVGGVDAVGQGDDFSNVRFDLAEMLKRGYDSVEVLFFHADELTDGEVV